MFLIIGPPIQLDLDSTVQVELQPSPLIIFLSSQYAIFEFILRKEEIKLKHSMKSAIV